MNTRRITRLMLTILVLAAATEVSVAVETEAAIKKKFEARHKALLKFKTAGKIGETAKGYVEPLEPSFAREPKVKSLVDAENADRKTLYGLLARKQKASVGEVARQNAILKFKKAGTEEFFKGKDGVWRKKKDMLK